VQKNYLYIALAIVLTGMISVSAHALIIQYFQAPNLKIDPFLNQAVGYLIRFGMIIAPMFIYLYSKEYWANIKPFKRIILFTILISALVESLRGFIMQIVCGTPWTYQILVDLPHYLSFLSISFIVCIFVQSASETKHFKLLKYVALTILGIALMSVVKIINHALLVPLLAHMPQPLSGPQVPYGANILIPAYITYLEPTIASFIVFYLIKDKLSTYSTMTNGFIMGAIIITIHGGIFSILQIACSTGNIFYRIFYYGQFLWEYLALGLLTAYSFDLLQNRRIFLTRRRK